MSLITCEKATFAYEGVPVVKELDLQIEKGQYLCIVGENGSGKSTLVKGLLGLLKPVSGSVAFGDGLHQTEIGYLPQRSEIQPDFPASVWEVVSSGCHGLWMNARHQRMAEENLGDIICKMICSIEPCFIFGKKVIIQNSNVDGSVCLKIILTDV